MTRIYNAIGFVIGITIIVIFPVLMFYGARGLWRELNSADTNLVIALITAASTIFVSTVTVMIGRYYERKKEIEAHFRSVKLAMYEEFMEHFFKLFSVDENEEKVDLTSFLRQWQRKIALKAGPNVLNKYFSWKTALRKDPTSSRSILAMDEFFRALRADVGQSSRGLEKGAFVHLIIKNPDLFLDAMKTNPNVTLGQLSELEEKLGVD